MNDQPSEILTIDEVAAFRKAANHKVYRLEASGKLLTVKPSGTCRFRRGETDRWNGSCIGAATIDYDEGAE